jgi:hypothetical protein
MPLYNAGSWRWVPRLRASVFNGDWFEACHGEAAERQLIVAVALVNLNDLIDLADAKDVLCQCVVGAANELGHE